MAARQGPALRRVRERELAEATRRLFDARGVQEAPVEEIARAVGIARGQIYRHFSSKEELYVLTITTYLDELDEVLAAAIAGSDDPEDRLRGIVEAFADYCQRYPAFLDCSQSLMRRPALGLKEVVSDAVWLRLGQGMASCLNRVALVVRDLGVEEAAYVANVLWTQTLGIMHLARIRVGVRQAAPGVPDLFSVDTEQVMETCVGCAFATVGAHGGRPSRIG